MRCGDRIDYACHGLPRHEPGGNAGNNVHNHFAVCHDEIKHRGQRIVPQIPQKLRNPLKCAGDGFLERRPVDICGQVGERLRNVVDGGGQQLHAAALCKRSRDKINEVRFEVAESALNGRCGFGCLHRRIREAKLHNGLVELVGGDFALFHRLAEIPDVCAVFQHGLLQNAGCARDGVCKLVPVFGGQLPRARRLRQHHCHAFERVGVAARNGVKVARRFGQLLKIRHAVCAQLRGGIGYRFQVVHRACGVVLHGGRNFGDGAGIKPGEIHRGFKFRQAVGGVQRLTCQTSDFGSDIAERIGQHVANERTLDDVAKSTRLLAYRLQFVAEIVGFGGCGFKPPFVRLQIAGQVFDFARKPLCAARPFAEFKHRVCVFVFQPGQLVFLRADRVVKAFQRRFNARGLAGQARKLGVHLVQHGSCVQVVAAQPLHARFLLVKRPRSFCRFGGGLPVFLDGVHQLGVELLRFAGRLRILVAKQLDALLLHVNLLGQHAHLCGQLGLRTVILVERRGHGFHFSRQRLRLRYDVFDAAVEFRSAV